MVNSGVVLMDLTAPPADTATENAAALTLSGMLMTPTRVGQCGGKWRYPPQEFELLLRTVEVFMNVDDFLWSTTLPGPVNASFLSFSGSGTACDRLAVFGDLVMEKSLEDLEMFTLSIDDGPGNGEFFLHFLSLGPHLPMCSTKQLIRIAPTNPTIAAGLAPMSSKTTLFLSAAPITSESVAAPAVARRADIPSVAGCSSHQQT